MVKNLPAKQKTQVWSLGGEDPLGKEMATHSRKSHGQRSLAGYSPWDHRVTTEWLNHHYNTLKSFFLFWTEKETLNITSSVSCRPLVTSFTGKYGSIQYCVRAVLERPQAPDQSVKRELQVVSHIDVNTPALLVRSSARPSPAPLFAFGHHPCI